MFFGYLTSITTRENPEIRVSVLHCVCKPDLVQVFLICWCLPEAPVDTVILLDIGLDTSLVNMPKHKSLGLEKLTDLDREYNLLLVLIKGDKYGTKKNYFSIK